MKFHRILIANRGEIAIRVARAASDLGIQAITIYSQDDAESLHVLAGDKSYALMGSGAGAYLDKQQIISLALDAECDAVHPGYGFLSESADFAQLCAQANLAFIGPSAKTLKLFGDKARTRNLAGECGVPVMPGSGGPITLKEALDFFVSLGHDAAVVVKAVKGGGGRGIRPVYRLDDLEEAYNLCRSEAAKAFGCGDVYIEQYMPQARHIEVQVIGDGRQVIHLGERECTLQRRGQKLIEVSPSPSVSTKLRAELTGAALRMARHVNYISLGTFEFLVDRSSGSKPLFAFLETNPRLQVEHTVTEEVTGIDLVRAQIEIAAGKTLPELGLVHDWPHPRIYALQARINLERIDHAGNVIPSAGRIGVYEAPSGPGIRVDGCGYSGYTINPAFDSLLAKLIITSRSDKYQDAVVRMQRTLQEFRIEGVETNIPFLINLLSRQEVKNNDIHTRFIEDNANALALMQDKWQERFFSSDRSVRSAQAELEQHPAPPGTIPLKAPMQGCVVDIEVIEGDAVTAGQKLVVLESMKMEHVITAVCSGYVRAISVSLNESVKAGSPLLFLEEAEVNADIKTTESEPDLDVIRPDLAEVIERHSFTLDERRPEAVAKRRRKNQRTARENVNDLCDPGSFIEYGALIVAAQRGRRPLDELIRKTPADGLITGIGTVNRNLFDEARSRCMVLAYDFTVLAGTQGLFNHKKMDRMLHIADRWHLPIVLFAEGGGGRPGDTDANVVAGLDLTTFSRFAALSGKVPLIGIVEGACFAGNASLLGCCDVIIATRGSNIGMGGPAMIEGGGLGVVKVDDIGPIDVQTRNGVVDIEVANEAEAVSVARKYLSYFQGPIASWKSADQRKLRWLIPENRLRVYDVRKVIEGLADTGSVLEMRPRFGTGMITALVRIEGRPFGLIANDPRHMGGAIEADDADKAARFLQLCDVHRLPVLSLCDTPGFMVGPEIEERAQVRHVCRMFVVGSHMTVPYFTIVLRKGYGLGAMAMAAGSFHDSFFTIAWPTGEFGGMGLEGAVKHGFKKELEAIKDPAEREATYKFFVEQAYAMGKGLNMASYMEIDAVIDPAETRRWIMRSLDSVQKKIPQASGRTFIDPW